MPSSTQTQPTQTQPTPPVTEHIHSLGEWKVIQTLTCGLPEVTRRECACGYFEEQQTQPPTGLHQYDENGQCQGCDRKTSGGLFYKLTEDKTAYAVIGIGSCEDTAIVIPEVYNGKPVTVIREYAFASMGSDPSVIQSITIPASVTTIGMGAFAGCQQLTEIHVEEESQHFMCIESILYSKDGKTLVAYPGGMEAADFQIPNHVECIGDYAFAHCSKLKNVILSDAVHTVGSGAFGSSTLQTITFGTGMQTIGTQAFAMCGEFVSILVKDDNPNFISKDGVLFSKDETVLYVYPAGRTAEQYTGSEVVTTIMPEAFYGCQSLKTVTMSGVQSIGENAFFHCEKLESAEFSSVITVGCEAFAWCNRLDQIILGEALEVINQGAFQGCETLKKVQLPETVKKLAKGVFYHCLGLEEIRYAGTVAQWCAIELEAGWDGMDVNYTLYCSDMLEFSTGLEFAKTDDGSYVIAGIGSCVDTTIIIPALYKGALVTGIADFAFSGSNAEVIILADSIRSLGGACFSGSPALKRIQLGSGMTYLAAPSFQGCPALEEILVSEANHLYLSVDGVLYTKNGSALVYYPAGKQQTEYAVIDGVLSIMERAFYDCDMLTTVTMPVTLQAIGLEAFMDCDALVEVSVPANLISIGQEAFFDCSRLEKILFAGTLEQWNAIPKGDLWDENTASYMVMCSDGTLTLDFWTVIGTIAGDSWTVDIPMQQLADGTWQTQEAIALEVGDQFKCRRSGAWELAFPQENYVVETAGTFFIQLDPKTGAINLIEA